MLMKCPLAINVKIIRTSIFTLHVMNVIRRVSFHRSQTYLDVVI